jgi:cytochrome c-type biogenesis protein CcsB
VFKMSEYAAIAALLCAGLAFLTYLAHVASGFSAARVQAAGVPYTTGVRFVSGPRTQSIGRYATIFGWLAMFALTVSLITRSLHTGHGPFSNQYEFSMAFAWGVLVTYYWFERRYQLRMLGIFALFIAVALMLATRIMVTAGIISTDADPLMPALQNNLLLTVHVAVAIIAYGSFSVAFGAAILYLIQPEGGRWGLPRPELLDEVSYRAVVVGFPFLTLTIVLGAVWANVAWGTYWSWDPKETASLVTWLIYGAYLHARVVRGWRGRKSAMLLLAGFAATLFTFFGINLMGFGQGSLHSYAGLGN